LFRACGLALLLVASIGNTAYASDANAPVADAHSKPQKSAQANAGSEPFVGPASEAKKLYRRYKRAHDKTVVAIACVRDPKCIEPEDEVLRQKLMP